ncbi:GT4 family glycosyltransferase PelF [Streptomyces sp. NPDC054904]|uniref:GT4 family glycosyltransferase PelF n=1 Tax=unclassified Streptomyces TaxID=2593676 RepID=UPI002481F508|nr:MULTISPECIES: GT4 family glycosyltransferase PelF [unclassified Streptomyces]MDA5284768.1 GT4 family glycosyltransferase PelF [Streptomyces sp. Isolate_45]MDX2389883.1 GT4 family glycosyltransferase PelF [Streptomyces sp. DK15]
MRIALLTEGGYPYAAGEARLWCDRLVRGLPQHEFELYALSRSARQEEHGRVRLPDHVTRVRTAPLWAPADDGRTHSRRERRRFTEAFGELVRGVCAGQGDPFAAGLYDLAELARDQGGMYAALRSETAVRTVESACRARGAGRAVQQAQVPDLLEFVDELEKALRPLSLDWYEDGGEGLGAVDVCHAAAGGVAALPGLLAKRFFGVPLLVTEYGVQLRSHYLADTDDTRPALRALLAAFHTRLAGEIYARADLLTPGNAHARRWQERCGAPRDRLRTVYPGMEADRFAAVGEEPDCGDPDTLVWVGRIDPAKDLIALLHAFAEVRRAAPRARLRIFATAVAPGAAALGYLADCRSLAAQLFPDEAADARTVGESPVTFEEVGGPEAPSPADAYGAGRIVVLSSVIEGFPITLAEAMFCGRATVSTDVGAVREVIGGTGLVVPPRNPRALADACLALLGEPERAQRLGAAARARALELFTVEQNVTAFQEIYLRLLARGSARPDGEIPFEQPAEARVPGHWTTPTWAAPGPTGGAPGITEATA